LRQLGATRGPRGAKRGSGEKQLESGDASNTLNWKFR
jgi:hypothetical protein